MCKLRGKLFARCCVIALLAGSAIVWAAPPPWAPAHGWRKKNDPFYVGYAGREWSADYGVVSGRCNTDQVLAAAGAVTGAVVGNRTASPENRTVATILGAIIGGLIGSKVGDAIDDGDRGCIGHSMELARVGQPVTWTNSRSGITYNLRPTRDLSGGCREFTLEAKGARSAPPEKMTACARGAGEWTLK